MKIPLLTFLFLTIFFSGLICAAEVNEQDDELILLGRIVSDFAYSASRAKEQNATARAQLAQEDQELRGSDITPALLERTRLEMETNRSKHNSLLARLGMRQESLTQMEKELALLDKEIKRLAKTEAGVDPEQKASLITKFQNLAQKKLLTEELVLHLQELIKQVQAQSALSADRFNLLQSRFTLSSVNLKAIKADPREKRIKRDIDFHLSQAAKFRNTADSISGNTDIAIADKKHAEFKAQISDEFVELKQSELKLVQTEQSLTNSLVLTRADSIPVKVLKSTKIKVEEIYTGIENELNQLTRKYDLSNNQRNIIAKLDPENSAEKKLQTAELELFDSALKENINLQVIAQKLLSGKENAMKQFDTMISRGLRRETFEKRVLPSDLEGWQHLGGTLQNLPLRIIEEFVLSFKETINGLQQAAASQLIILFLGLVLLGVAIFVLRKIMVFWLKRRHVDNTLTAPVAALNRNLPLLIIPVIWGIFSWSLTLSTKTLWLFLIPLALWPVIRFTLNLARTFLLDSSRDQSTATRLRFYHSLRWAVILVAILAALIIITRSIELLPAVVNVIDRLSMLCLLLIMIPTLHLRALITAKYGTGRNSKWARIAASLSVTIPIAISACALIGLFGYVNLAWSIAQHLSLLVLVAGLWRVTLAALRELTSWFSAYLNKHVSGSEFWIKHFVTPLYRISTVMAVVLSGYLLFWLYDWNEDTPIISAVPGILDTTIVTMGATMLKVHDVLLAAFIIFLVFWAGSWSKQVSYRLAYVKISDLGIRQSLSTFTQYVVVVLGLMLTLKVIGLDLTALTVFAGALGVGIGFGLQTIINNFVSGILLLAERPLRVSDIVTVDNFEGEVTNIGIRSLTVKTWDNQEVIIPNSSVITKPFTNWTRGDDVMRTLLMIGVSYKNDPQHAMQEISKILKEQAGVLATPSSKVLLWDFAESAVMIRVQFFSNINGDIGRSDLRSQILSKIWNRFAEVGIEIPFPQRDLYIHGLNRIQEDFPFANDKQQD